MWVFSSRSSSHETPFQHISYRRIFAKILFFSFIGLAASFVLSVEKVHLLQNPAAQLSCSFNAIFNCASVMKTPQASVFGFPNAFIGLMGFSVTTTVAVAGLIGVRFPRSFAIAAQIGCGLGLLFAYWLFFQSVYIIQILCPWCLAVTLATTLIFTMLLRYNLAENNVFLAKRAHKTTLAWLTKGYDTLLVSAWLVLLCVLILLQFREGLFG